MFKQILNPDYYHGKHKKKNFFEGWYYKIIDKENKYTLAIIPGIIKGKSKNAGHSFIQIIDGINNKSFYLQFSKDNFKAKSNDFYVQLDNNTFTLNEIKMNYCNKDIQIIGNLKFLDIVKWPCSILSPGSMGFYNYLFFMECYSQVCCLDGEVIGKLLINNEEIDFTGGKVYIEKNWGSNFPLAYIWVQANGFKNLKSALTVSIGIVPFLFTSFSGFLAAFKYEDKIYKFTTMNKSKMSIDYSSNNVIIIFEKDEIQLKVETFCKDSEFLLCKGPNRGDMDVDVKESVNSDVRVELVDLYRENIIFQGISKKSGVEFMGSLRDL